MASAFKSGQAVNTVDVIGEDGTPSQAAVTAASKAYVDAVLDELKGLIMLPVGSIIYTDEGTTPPFAYGT